MDSKEINFDFQVDLPERLIDSSNQGPISLLQLDEITGPYSFVRVEAQVSEEEAQHSLYLSSFLETDQPPVAQSEVAIAIEATIAGAENEKHTEIDRPHKKAQIGMVVLRDDMYLDAATVILPSLSGRHWTINSQIMNTSEDREEDVSSVEVLIEQHLLALNALSAVLESAHRQLELETPEEEETSDEPRVLFLDVPGVDLEVYEGPEQLPVELNTDPFEGFVGIDNTVSRLREVVKIANTPAEELKANSVRPIQSVLLHGPSGTGKTELMSSLADALDAEPITVDFSDLSSKWTGKWASNIEKVFKEAYEKEGRVLIIFDEMDGLVTSGNEGSMANINAVLKRQLEEIKKHPNVFFAGATNKLDAIDPDVRAKKRIPLKLTIQHPNQTERIAIFEELLIGKKLALLEADDEDLNTLIGIHMGMDSLDLQKLADETDGLSAGDIVEIINDVHMRRFLDADKTDGAEQSQGLPSQDEILSAIRSAAREES